MGLFDRWKNQPMNEVHQDLVAVYQETATKLSSNSDEQLQFLEYASQLYKYNLNDKQQKNKVAAPEVELSDLDTPSISQSVSHEQMM